MRRLFELALLSFACFLAAGCGGKIAPSSDDTGGAADPTPSSSVTSSPTPPPPPSSGPGQLPPSTPSATTYSAYAWGGGLDHVEIFKADYAANTCVHLHLASPQKPGLNGAFAGIKTPPSWVVRNGERTNDASACKPQAQSGGMSAVDGKGVISWDGEPRVLPCTLNVHAAVIFDKLKAAEQLDADGVPVDGCM